MNSNIGTIGTGNSYSSSSFSDGEIPHALTSGLSQRAWFDRILFFVKGIVEYGFGMYMGAAFGWILGWLIGDAYVECFEPVYFSDFANLSELTQWSEIPYEFAATGKFCGAAVGAMIIMIINSRLFTKRVISLIEEQVTEPQEIALFLAKGEPQIRRKLSKLRKKGKLVADGQSEKNHENWKESEEIVNRKCLVG